MKYANSRQWQPFDSQNSPIIREYSKPYAFTLVELLVVISVIAMLAAMLMPALAKTTERARSSQCESNRHQYELAERMYEADWNDVPSDELESLRTSKYLNTEKLMECPSKGVYLWIGERGRDLSPEMGCSVHDFSTDLYETSSSDDDDDVGSEDPPSGNDGNGNGNGNNGGGNSGGGSGSGAIDPLSTTIFVLLMATMAFSAFHDPRKSRN